MTQDGSKINPDKEVFSGTPPSRKPLGGILRWAMGCGESEALVPGYDPPPIKVRTGPKPGY